MKTSGMFSLLAGGLLGFVLVPAAMAQVPADNSQGPLPEPEINLMVEPTVTDPSTPPFTKKVNPHDGLTYLWIPPGKFMMGCSPGDTECDTDEKAHEVTIRTGFWISTTLVTQAAYKRITSVNPSFFKGDLQRPVERVDWGEALNYCTALGMRLPTEAEYEYAARAGETAARYGEVNQIAWYKDNSREHTHAVGEKLPNAWGLYDMLGNVWEYTSDPYKPDDPNYVAMRGGGWITSEKGIRLSFRGFDSADRHRKFSGFRCVAD